MKVKVILQFDIEVPESLMTLPKGRIEPELLRYMYKSGIDTQDGIVLEATERTKDDE